ncbi:fluoride efflux transporter FluC [Mumia sp. Pv 4-285]|uniref:fluoride efflux transporter FluC n=1 Tax=Mumia qirimensis TaxID=3234852 RepID=UPI00351CF8EC
MRGAARRPVFLLVVVLGGAAGTLGRAGLGELWPHDPDALPLATGTANVVGAFLLGLLLERLVVGGEETPPRLLLRLGLGAGVLGGFTTFSGLALDTVTLVRADALALALAYAVGSVVLGLAACLAGVRLGAGRRWESR